MAILKSIYRGSNIREFVPKANIEVFTDSEVLNTDIGTVLPNNGSRYDTVENIKYVPSGSSGVVYTPSTMIVATFIAELGSIDTTTGYNEGVWNVIARVPYKK